jgi:hypothetical protein
MIAHDTNITELHFPDLITVCGGIDIEDAPQITTLNMTKAIALDGIDIKFINVPNFGVFITEHHTPLRLASLEIRNGPTDGVGDYNITQCVGQLTLHDLYSASWNKLLYVGNLTADNVEIVSVDYVLSVNGTVNITGSSNTQPLVFSNLTSITGSLLLSNNTFNAAYLPSLKSLGGDVIFQNNSQLRDIEINSLTTVDNIEISGSPYLTSINTSTQLQTINDLAIGATLENL